MSDHDALLAAIIANWDDDTPRLVMADWFQENGDEKRAELIRVQCELARLPEPPMDYNPPTIDGFRTFCAACGVLQRAERNPNAACRYHWLRFYEVLSLSPLLALWEVGSCAYCRGFVESVTCAAADWFAHAPALHWSPYEGKPCPPTAQPIRKVVLTTWPKLSVHSVSVHSVNTGRSVERYFVFDGFGFTERSQLAAELYRRHDSRIEFELPPGPIGVVSLASSDRGDNVFEGLIMLAE